MRPYLAETGGHQKNALTLYRWNVAISAKLYEAVSYFEVPLRNAMDERLRSWNATQQSALGRRLNSDWCHEPSPVLDRIARSDIDKAYDRAQKALDAKHGDGVRLPSHDDVIAQTTLGLWRFLLPSKSDAGKQVLWNQALGSAFPHLRRPVDQLVTAVDSVYRIRNRVAHLEPLIHLNLAAVLVNMQTVLGDVDPGLRSWFTGVTSGFQAGLQARPR